MKPTDTSPITSPAVSSSRSQLADHSRRDGIFPFAEDGARDKRDTELCEVPPPCLNPDRICQIIENLSEKALNRLKFRFNLRVAKQDGPDACWLWTGGCKGGRYGEIRLNTFDRAAAHRLSFLFANGYLPADKLVCHTCDVEKCVRPSHLFLGTHKENTADSCRKGRFKPFGQRIGSFVPGTLPKKPAKPSRCKMLGVPRGYHLRKLTIEQAREAALIRQEGGCVAEFARSINKQPHTVLKIVRRNKYAGEVLITPPRRQSAA